MKFSLTTGQLKVLSSVLENLAAAWLASIVVFPSLFGIQSVSELLFLLTYSLSFAMLTMYLAAKIEDKLL